MVLDRDLCGDDPALLAILGGVAHRVAVYVTE
jgi:hypothetical protein